MDDFEEKVAAAIEKGRKAHAEEQRLDHEFRTTWDQRRVEIKKLLVQLKNTLQDTRWDAGTEILNGDITLHVRSASRTEFKLTLARNDKKRVIDCRASPDVFGDGIEAFTVDELDVAEMQRLVLRFIEGVAMWPLRSKA